MAVLEPYAPCGCMEHALIRNEDGDVVNRPVGSYDFDGTLWVRTEDGELCGPYKDRDEAKADFSNVHIDERTEDRRG